MGLSRGKILEKRGDGNWVEHERNSSPVHWRKRSSGEGLLGRKTSAEFFVGINQKACAPTEPFSWVGGPLPRDNEPDHNQRC